MTYRDPFPAGPARDAHGLFPERRDYRAERGRGHVTPRRARRRRSVALEVSGIRPQSEAGPVDLTIYAPKRDLPTATRPSYPLDPDEYVVVLEATLPVRRGRARFRFRTVATDTRGRYVAVFRRTDVSSWPVARRSFFVD